MFTAALKQRLLHLQLATRMSASAGSCGAHLPAAADPIGSASSLLACEDVLDLLTSASPPHQFAAPPLEDLLIDHSRQLGSSSDSFTGQDRLSAGTFPESQHASSSSTFSHELDTAWPDPRFLQLNHDLFDEAALAFFDESPTNAASDFLFTASEAAQDSAFTALPPNGGSGRSASAYHAAAPGGSQTPLQHGAPTAAAVASSSTQAQPCWDIHQPLAACNVSEASMPQQLAAEGARLAAAPPGQTLAPPFMHPTPAQPGLLVATPRASAVAMPPLPLQAAAMAQQPAAGSAAQKRTRQQELNRIQQAACRKRKRVRCVLC